MKVDDELETMVLRPPYSFAEIGKLALDVRLAALHVPGPVADGQANVIETDGRNNRRSARGTGKLE